MRAWRALHHDPAWAGGGALLTVVLQGHGLEGLIHGKIEPNVRDDADHTGQPALVQRARPLLQPHVGEAGRWLGQGGAACRARHAAPRLPARCLAAWLSTLGLRTVLTSRTITVAACQMPRYCELVPSCTVRRPRTMSKGYVADMATMPAPAPAMSRRKGVISPLPVVAL